MITRAPLAAEIYYGQFKSGWAKKKKKPAEQTKETYGLEVGGHAHTEKQKWNKRRSVRGRCKRVYKGVKLKKRTKHDKARTRPRTHKM